MYAYHQHNGALYKDEVQIGTGYRQVIRNIRISRNESQREFAAQIGVTDATLPCAKRGSY